MREIQLKAVQLEKLREEFNVHYKPKMNHKYDGFYALLLREPLISPFMQAIEPLEGEYVKATFTITAPRYEVKEHTDKVAPPHYSRWHLPLQTQETVLYEQGVPTYMYEGSWYGPVIYWLPHSVVNNSDIERIHLIVDLTL